MHRKKFIKDVAISSLGVVIAGSVLSACSNDDEPEQVDFTIDMATPEYESLKEDNGFAIVDRVLVVNNKGEYIALAKVCTHQECPVSYVPSSRQLPCPCHGSIFDIEGNVLQGPAQLPLKRYTVTVEGTVIRVTD